VRARALAITTLLPALVVLLSPLESIDDSFISFRYALNMVQGYGLVYNPGQRVEGYTNLLWTLLAAAAIWAGVSVTPLMSWIGILFAWLSLITLWRLCRLLRVGCISTTLALVSVALYQNFWTVAANGLEEGLFSFLLMQTVYWLARRQYLVAGIVGALLFATRPDSLAVIPLGAVWVLFSARDGEPLKDRFQKLRPLLLPWISLVLGLTMWRVAYYHALLPNTIVAKAAPLDLAFIERNVNAGVIYWLAFLVSSFPLSLALIGAPFVRRRRRDIGLLCCAILGAQVPVILLAGGDWMPGFRLLSSYAPLLGLMLALTLSSSAGSIAWRPQSALLVAAAVLGAWIFVLPHYSWHSPTLQVVSAEPCWQDISSRLAPYVRRSDVLAPEAIGVFGYELHRSRIYDFQGLTDAYTAHHGTIYIPRFGKFAPDYTFRRVRPTLFIFQTGTNFLVSLIKASHAAYNRGYASYAVSSYPQCGGKHIVISVRKRQGAHLLPAFHGLSLSPVSPAPSVPAR
jgi:arabinofuranosyltransferase